MTEQNQNAENNITTDAAPAQSPLGLIDLQNAAQIIEVAVARGAFRANEATQVGGVYDRLAAFIRTVQANQPAAEPTADTTQS